MMDRTGYKDEQKVFAGMNTFLMEVKNDLEKYVLSGGDICRLHHMFQNGHGPDYNDSHVQQLYILRYIWAYGFENKLLYKWMLNNRDNHEDLTVESVGSGCGVDSWSLYQAVKGTNLKTNHIRYDSVDLVKWKYRLGTLRTNFHNINAADYYTAKETLESEVYVFPRSIGDFNERDFHVIYKSLSEKIIKRSTVFLLLSQRKGREQVSSKDKERTFRLRDAFMRQGFNIVKELEEDNTMTEGISKYDRGYPKYPEQVISFLKSLKNGCNNRGQKSECIYNCDLDHGPMLKANNLCYNAFKFER